MNPHPTIKRKLSKLIIQAVCRGVYVRFHQGRFSVIEVSLALLQLTHPFGCILVLPLN